MKILSLQGEAISEGLRVFTLQYDICQAYNRQFTALIVLKIGENPDKSLRI